MWRFATLIISIFFDWGRFSLLSFNPGGHTAYQDFLVENLCKYYPNPDSIPTNVWDIMERFYLKDLSKVDEMMRDRYSVFNPKPRLPSCMLRSIMLALEFKVTSYTAWANQLKLNPLYTLLSAFDFGDTPGTGTFYDFNRRLWLSAYKGFSTHERVPKTSVKKPSKNCNKSMSIDKLNVEELLIKLESEPISTEQPFRRLFDIFSDEFLSESVERNLINPSKLSLAGDGTPAVTSARERKRRICKCKESGVNNCDCARYYYQPDCNVGWDSSRKLFYSGYSLYTFTASDSESDLFINILCCSSYK